MESGGNDPRVVKDEQIYGREKLGQISELQIRQTGTRWHMKKPALGPNLEWRLRDEFRGEVVIKV